MYIIADTTPRHGTTFEIIRWLPCTHPHTNTNTLRCYTRAYSEPQTTAARRCKTPLPHLEFAAASAAACIYSIMNTCILPLHFITAHRKQGSKKNEGRSVAQCCLALLLHLLGHELGPRTCALAIVQQYYYSTVICTVLASGLTL
jgi:hypothetical protein